MHKVIFALSLIFTTTVSFSQKRFHTGLRIGISSLHGGITEEMRIAGPLYVQAEALYSTNFKKLRILGFVPQSGIAYINSSSIMIPLQAKLKFGKVVRPYFMLGIAPTFKLKATARPMDEKYDIDIAQIDYDTYTLSLGPDGSYNHQKKVDITQYTDMYRTNIVTTVGLEVQIKKVVPFIDLRYVANPGAPHYADPNTYFQASVGVKF